MATASEIAAIADLSEVDAAAIGYLAAADGDVDKALIWAVEDLLRAERELVTAWQTVSRGYVRSAVPAQARQA